MYVCSSVGMEHFGSQWMDFREIWYLNIFLKPIENYGTGFLLESEMFKTKVAEEIKAHISYSITFPPKVVAFVG
jgi:hypothetical protein